MRGRGVESVFTHYFYQSVQNKSVKSPLLISNKKLSRMGIVFLLTITFPID